MPRKVVGYTISAVAEIYDVHPQTLRAYERQGLLTPSRSEGNTRLYTQPDLQRLEVILNLTRELGVNLAGVEVILNMRQKMAQMQREVSQLIEFLHQRFDIDPGLFRGVQNALVRMPPVRPVRVRRPVRIVAEERQD